MVADDEFEDDEAEARAGEAGVEQPEAGCGQGKAQNVCPAVICGPLLWGHEIDTAFPNRHANRLSYSRETRVKTDEYSISVVLRLTHSNGNGFAFVARKRKI
jgi:hypothetical protein